MSDQNLKLAVAAPRLIYAAIAKVMLDVGAVGKSRKNQQQNYQFRGIDDVMAHVQEVMANHGVVCVPSVRERERELVSTKSGGSMASVRLLVDHVFYASDGSSVTCTTLGEAMDSGDKASNKAMSAALKYALTQTFMIPTYEVDRDTEEHSPEMDEKPTQRVSQKPDGKDVWTASRFEAACLRIFPGVSKSDVEARVDGALSLMGADRTALQPKQTVWQLFMTGPVHLRREVIEKAEKEASEAMGEMPDFHGDAK